MAYHCPSNHKCTAPTLALYSHLSHTHPHTPIIIVMYGTIVFLTTPAEKIFTCYWLWCKIEIAPFLLGHKQQWASNIQAVTLLAGPSLTFNFGGSLNPVEPLPDCSLYQSSSTGCLAAFSVHCVTTRLHILHISSLTFAVALTAM